MTPSSPKSVKAWVDGDLRGEALNEWVAIAPSWITACLDELMYFPAVRYDGQVDRLSSGLAMLAKPKRRILYAEPFSLVVLCYRSGKAILGTIEARCKIMSDSVIIKRLSHNTVSGVVIERLLDN